MDATQKYIITTVTGYVLLVVWLASVLASPLIVLDPGVQTVVFGLAVAALGLQTYSGYSSTREAATMKRDNDAW